MFFSKKNNKERKLSILFLTVYIYGMKTYTEQIVKRLQRNKRISVNLIAFNSRNYTIGQVLFHIRNIFRPYWKYDIVISNNFVAPYLISRKKIEIYAPPVPENLGVYINHI